MEKWRMKILYPMSQALLHLRNSVSYFQDPKKYGMKVLIPQIRRIRYMHIE